MNTGRELAEAVLAIAGVPPQHNSPDRDDYVNVFEENIIPGTVFIVIILIAFKYYLEKLK